MSQSVGDFLLRRIARIYPLYVALMVVRIVWTLAVYGQFHAPQQPFAVTMTDLWHDVPANLLLVQSWGVSPSINGPGWSVSTKWAAYSVFPLLVIPALFRSRRAAWLLGIGAAILLLSAAAYAGIERPGRRLLRALPLRPRSSIVLPRHEVRQ